MKPHRHGTALCVLSACGFGAMAIFAKEAYADGVSVLTLLAVRFPLAAALFWAIVVARGIPLPSRRMLLTGLVLGAAGYATEAGLYFGALTRIDASLTSVLLYTYPALVFLGALAVRREHVTPLRVGALGLASAGTALVLLAGHLGAVDGLGLAMALTSAVIYAAYVLVADRIVTGVDPFVLAATVTTGASISLVAAGAGSGSLDFTFGAAGWGWIAALAFGSTVVGISAFYAGLRAVGPATASIISTVEPVTTVALATAIYGETLGAGQITGGVLVLGAVVLLQVRAAGTVTRDDAPARRSAAPPARTLAHDAA